MYFSGRDDHEALIEFNRVPMDIDEATDWFNEILFNQLKIFVLRA